MQVIIGYPPNFDAIDAVFHIRRLNKQNMAFCYGDVIYTPKPWTIIMPDDIVQHEGVHSRQQAGMGGPEPWWDRYLLEKQFRLEQEIEACRVQWKAIVDSGMTRPRRRKHLAFMSELLAGPIYGYMISKSDAKREIKGGEAE